MADACFERSGVHWSWGNRQVPGRPPFSQPLSGKATDEASARERWPLSERFTGLV